MKKKLEYQKYINLKQKYQNIVSNIATLRMITFITLIISFIGKYYYAPILLNTIFIISLIIFVCLIFIHDKYYKIYDYYQKYVDVIMNYLDRENEKWKNFEDTGADFLNNAPYYYQDLDIFGKHSLFQYISICKTLGGRKKLKEKLSNIEYSEQSLKEEQEMIKELSNKINFLMDFNVLLSFYHNKKIDLTEKFSILRKEKSNKKQDIVIAVICSIITILLLILSLLKIINIKYFYGMFLFNFMISFMYAYIYKEKFSEIETLITTYKGIEPIFKRCLQENFSSKKINKLKKDIKEGIESGEYLRKLDTINSLKSNIISNFIFNGLCCINLILAYSYLKFESQDLKELKQAIANIEELEAIISLANIGICFENKCMPILENEVEISFDTLIHPLLGEKKCIPNSFQSKNGVNIITGSNMGGKTSFLRTIGINIILMNSGTFVCAKEFHASYFKIFTSMRVNDDIANGISTFYGELLRIKDMVEYVNKGNMLVLIDEIFKGTNYQDRIYGAKEVIKRLNTKKTITMLTTHDFELCEEKDITNYHVKEAYEQDKIIFDYKIRNGKCTSTNARYLMTKLGIIEK